MAKQLLFLLDWYPTQTNNGCIFAKHLICAIADLGYDCVVVAPRVISRDALRKVNRAPYFREELTASGSRVRIYMPHYLHLSSRKQTMKFSMDNHYRSVLRTIRREKLRPDLVYGHFIYQNGLTAARVGEKLGIPAYCACGENSLRLAQGSLPYATGISYHGWKEILAKLSGIICVSSNNETLLRENSFIDASMPTGVFPNGVDETKFYPMDKLSCRKALGFPEDAFIVAYTGTFSANKGVDRLSSALKACSNVYSVFLGQGALEPECENILFQGRVPNDQVATYLNAADVFVLPTRGEGCCNAIVEALSCGLPVISSDLPFNDDILSAENSLRVDVEDVAALQQSIQHLQQDAVLRQALSQGALTSSDALKIRQRAIRILEFMEF